MALITTENKNKLYLKVKHELGYPLRPFPLKDEMLDSYFEMVIEDYSSLLNSWLIQQQWIGLEGLSSENSDFLSAFTTKPNTYMESFTYAYSKQVGLGTNAPAAEGWELKRDYITITAGTQHYIIPAHREVNEVLWETPPEVDSGLVDPFSMNAWSAGMLGWSINGRPSQYVQPVYSTLLAAQDRSMKQRMIQSTLSYRITGLASGEKMLHLYPIPGERYEIGTMHGKHYSGSRVYYWYYDTSKTGRNKCIEENSDIVKLPSDPPTTVLSWDKMNDVAHQQIRNLLIAKVKIAMGGVLGFYSGEISLTEKQLTLDYRHLLDEGQKLKEETEKLIMDQLENLTQVNLTEARAKIGQNINDFLTHQPPRTPIILI
jgi:hypothetical protein